MVEIMPEYLRICGFPDLQWRLLRLGKAERKKRTHSFVGICSGVQNPQTRKPGDADRESLVSGLRREILAC
jgi:hypothetical protein